jgi:hypothetical protein
MCEATLAVTCNMRFEVNIEKSTVELELTNFNDASSKMLSFSQETVADERWLNNVGGFILREIDSLENKQLPGEEEKARIQLQLEDLRRKQEKAEREIQATVKIGATGREEQARKRVEVLKKLQTKLLERLEEG